MTLHYVMRNIMESLNGLQIDLDASILKYEIS